MKFYEKGNKKAFESQIVFISLASKKMDLASTTKFVFAFASKLPMSVCLCAVVQKWADF